jgi:hypothetical protein
VFDLIEENGIIAIRYYPFSSSAIIAGRLQAKHPLRHKSAGTKNLKGIAW